VRKIGDLQSCERRQRRVSDLPAADAAVGPMKIRRRLRQRVADPVVCGARTCDEERGQPPRVALSHRLNTIAVDLFLSPFYGLPVRPFQNNELYKVYMWFYSRASAIFFVSLLVFRSFFVTYY
jgi:hypothetical protein